MEKMKMILDKVLYFLTKKDERGATAVEYALIVALIAVAIIAAVGALGGGITGAFQRITTAVGGTTPTT